MTPSVIFFNMLGAGYPSNLTVWSDSFTIDYHDELKKTGIILVGYCRFG